MLHLIVDVGLVSLLVQARNLNIVVEQVTHGFEYLLLCVQFQKVRMSQSHTKD